MKIKTKLSDPRCEPVYATDGSAGMDLKANIQVGFILADIGKIITVPTGVFMEIPQGYEGQIRPRSGLFKQGIFTTGTIDSDYRGEIMVTLIVLSRTWVEIEPFERIAQLVIVPVAKAELEIVAELSETKRGTGGFGSTGRTDIQQGGHGGC